MQKKCVLPIEAREIAMKLEALLVGDIGSGMMQIQLQLDNFTVQLRDIKRGNEVQEELWCTRCRTDGNHKDNFLALMNYVAGGAPNPLNTQGIPWCRVCQTRGHKSEECMYLQQILSAPTSLYCNFCRLV